MFDSVKEHNGALAITTKNGSHAIPKIIELAEGAGIAVDSATLKRPTLEDVFINLTGNEIREEGASDADLVKSAFRGTLRGRR
jgi:ABC-2 type transport system ATP-binding protein